MLSGASIDDLKPNAYLSLRSTDAETAEVSNGLVVAGILLGLTSGVCSRASPARFWGTYKNTMQHNALSHWQCSQAFMQYVRVVYAQTFGASRCL